MDLQTKSSVIAEATEILENIPTRDQLLETLSKELVEVTFKKLNGDERTMTCTLQPTYLPAATKEDLLSQTKIRNLEDKNVVVWDVNANNWRSFRYDRVSKVTQPMVNN